MNYKYIEIIPNRTKTKTILLGNSVCVVVADGVVKKMSAFDANSEDMVNELLEIGRWIVRNVQEVPNDNVIYRELFNQCNLGGCIESYMVGREVDVIVATSDMYRSSKSRVEVGLENKLIDRSALGRYVVRVAFGLDRKTPEELIMDCKGLRPWS